MEKIGRKNLSLLNDALLKAVFTSYEARDMVSSFLSDVTGIPKEDLMNATYQRGEIPKQNIK